MGPKFLDLLLNLQNSVIDVVRFCKEVSKRWLYIKGFWLECVFSLLIERKSYYIDMVGVGGSNPLGRTNKINNL